MVNSRFKTISSLIIIIVLVFVGFRIHTHKNRQFVNIATALVDVSPLYPYISWKEPVPATDDLTKKVGMKIDSLPIRDETYHANSPSFDQYYDARLVDAGWTRDHNIAADGAGSSVWGYTKNNKTIVLRYDSLQITPGAPDQIFSCPCDMTFSIFIEN